MKMAIFTLISVDGLRRRPFLAFNVSNKPSPELVQFSKLLFWRVILKILAYTLLILIECRDRDHFIWLIGLKIMYLKEFIVKAQAK